ncbi:PIN domain-containing protein [Gynurincola endophyticus]|uniref:PIN domain-containing protein n=1 Tax=Gynurincola endophyticus TaxID=2479004 RepID=UPI000F8E521C|nr:PIN domain-containing protein [Gynurincola endophyticus]
MKIFIDTNIYLDFYRSNSHPMEVFNLLKENIQSIVLTDQVIHEFERNREMVIEKVIEQFSSDSRIDTFTSSYLYELEVFQELLSTHRHYKSVQKTVTEQLKSIIHRPAGDPIDNFFSQLVNISIKENRVHSTTKDILRLAIRRKQHGNPPLSAK